LDSSGRVYVTGVPSLNMQATPGAYQSTATNANAYNGAVVRLKADGSLDYATYLGGGVPVGIAVDNPGTRSSPGMTTWEATPPHPALTFRAPLWAVRTLRA
jgi:hypothetical protein